MKTKLLSKTAVGALAAVSFFATLASAEVGGVLPPDVAASLSTQQLPPLAGLPAPDNSAAIMNNLLQTAINVDLASELSVQIFANSASGQLKEAADKPVLISWYSKGADTCTLQRAGVGARGIDPSSLTGQPVAQGKVGGQLQSYDGSFTDAIYTVTCPDPLGLKPAATAKVALSWLFYGVGGPRHASYAFPGGQNALMCAQAIASSDDKNCAKMVQIHFVAAHDVTGPPGGMCQCNPKGGASYAYDGEGRGGHRGSRTTYAGGAQSAGSQFANTSAAATDAAQGAAKGY